MTKFHFNLLTTAGIKGCIWFFLLFILTFGLVHIAKLIRLGWEHTQITPQTSKNETKEQNKPQEKAPAKPQEPIYYVIERKRKKPKATYTDPKQISFK